MSRGVQGRMKPNVIREKSYRFAVRAIHLARALRKQGEWDLARQLLRSGTSIGANVEEAQAGISRADFLARMGIASREARETEYWLRLARDTALLRPPESDSALSDVEELVRLLTAILKTGRSR